MAPVLTNDKYPGFISEGEDSTDSVCGVAFITSSDSVKLYRLYREFYKQMRLICLNISLLNFYKYI